MTVAAALLAACGGTDHGDPPEAALILQPGPAEVGEPLDLDIALDETGFFVFSAWPQACDLLTDAEITAVLPQAEVIERRSGDRDLEIIGSGQDVTAYDAGCGYELDIPEAGLGAEMVSGGPTIAVQIDAAGSPDVARLNARGSHGVPIEVPSGECHAWETTAGVSCLKGPLAFTIVSHFPHQQVGSDTWTDRYRVGGETTTFTDARGNESDRIFGQGEVFRRDALDVELAEIVLAKI
jgi:hypothetical protein